MTSQKNSSAAPKLGPRSQTIAASIHFYAQQHEWNLSQKDLVELTGYSTAQIRHVCDLKGWLGRLRSSKGPLLQRAPKIPLSVDLSTTTELQFE